MLKRLLVTLFISFVPFAALADTVTPDTSGLGPAATTSSEGSSSADSGALQPAGQSPLQSTTGDASGLTAPNANTLQAPASGNDALKVLADNADGSSTSLADDGAAPNYWGWLWATLLIAVLVGCAVMVARDRRRFGGHPADAKPSDSPISSLEADAQSEPSQNEDEDTDPDIAPEPDTKPAADDAPAAPAGQSITRTKRAKHSKRRKH